MVRKSCSRCSCTSGWVPSSAYQGPRRQPPKVTRSDRQRRAVGVLDEPVGMLLEEVRLLLGDERRHPDRRLEAAASDLPRARPARRRRTPRPSRASRPSRAGSRRRSARTSSPGTRLRDDVEVVEHLLRGDARAEAVPRAPAGRRRRHRGDSGGWCAARRSPAAASSAARSVPDVTINSSRCHVSPAPSDRPSQSSTARMRRSAKTKPAAEPARTR